MNEQQRMRDIESALAGARPEPIAPSLPTRPAQNAAAVRNGARIFAADVPSGDDAWGLDAALRPLAELATHKETEAPLTIAFLGGAGSGKSFAVAALLEQIEALARGATRESVLKRVPIVRIDAGRLASDATIGLAGALYDTLSTSHPDFIGSAAEAVRDPRAVAREVAEQLDSARRRLDTERQSLTEVESRRARIIETVLFETAGSRVDAYARASRATIESRFEGFGISGEPILNFKSMVRDLAESGGPVARASASLRALWAFKGQMRLLVTMVVLVLIGLGLGAAVTSQSAWLGWLQNLNESLEPTVAWMRAHIDWLGKLQQVAYAGAALALGLNILRAFRFMQPLLRGVGLLRSDVAAKRRDIDGLYAHQMRRVDHLTAEVERVARQAADAERRAGNHGGRPDLHLEPSPFDTGSLRLRADRFFAALGRLLQRAAPAASADAQKAPERVVVALDNIDALAPDTAYSVLEAAHQALAQPGLLTVLAFDPARLSNVRGEIAQRLEKWVQVPVRVGSDAAMLDARGFVAQIIGRSARKGDLGGQQAPIDWTLSDAEATILAALAPIAGSSPRTIKRFVNLYRLVRTQAPEFKAELALMLALDLGGTGAERAAIATALAEEGRADLDAVQLGPRIPSALSEAGVKELARPALRRAAAIVRCYSLRG